MSFINVNVHFVWGTKNRAQYLDSKETRRKAWEHIRENALKKNIFIDTINGYSDHCHTLISLGYDHTISQLMQLIKGESAYWINKNNLCRRKFEWQDEYYAVAVSPSNLDAVRRYIRNQEEHHGHTSFQKEVDAFIKASGFQKFEDGSFRPVDVMDQPLYFWPPVITGAKAPTGDNPPFHDSTS